MAGHAEADAGAAAAPPRLTLIARAECGLCEEMLTDLEILRQTEQLPELQVLDVDADPELQRRHGLDVPVLLLDGIPVCQQQLDAAALLRRL